MGRETIHDDSIKMHVNICLRFDFLGFEFFSHLTFNFRQRNNTTSYDMHAINFFYFFIF